MSVRTLFLWWSHPMCVCVCWSVGLLSDRMVQCFIIRSASQIVRWQELKETSQVPRLLAVQLNITATTCLEFPQWFALFHFQISKLGYFLHTARAHLQHVTSALYSVVQGGHSPGKPGKVREFHSKNEKSGKVRETEISVIVQCNYHWHKYWYWSHSLCHSALVTATMH